MSLLFSCAVALAAASPQTPQLQLQPGQRAASLVWPNEVFSLHSIDLDEDIRLFVAKPPSYERSTSDFPVLLALDGQYYFPELACVVASLVASGQIPELVLVGIESHDRRRDFTPAEIFLPDVGDEARADLYLDFLEHELLPVLESELRCGRPRVLLGHSHAGILVLHALARKPEVFPWGLALDAPTHLENDFLVHSLAKTLANQERPALRLVSCESRFEWPAERWTELTTLARPGDLLLRNAMPEESHESMVFAAGYRALQQLFADASAVTTRELSAFEVAEHYQALSAAYGAELPPPEPLMHQTVEDLLMEGFGARAGEWLARYESVYGRADDHDDLARQVAEVTALGEPEETVAELLALPRATPVEMAEHLGTWTGTTWMNDGPRETLGLRFWVADGVVQGELAHEQGPPQSIEYLRFRPDGALEFGFRNGMRPRGLLMHTEEVPGGPLEGEMHFRGIRFVPPDGHVMPHVYFELTREP